MANLDNCDLPAQAITIGSHPDGYRIDKTAAPMNRYTKWIFDADGNWTNPEPVCFHLLPQTGWQTETAFDWNDGETPCQPTK